MSSVSNQRDSTLVTAPTRTLCIFYIHCTVYISTCVLYYFSEILREFLQLKQPEEKKEEGTCTCVWCTVYMCIHVHKLLYHVCVCTCSCICTVHVMYSCVWHADKYILFFTVTEHVIQPNIPQESQETNPSRVCSCVYANRISKSICVVGLFTKVSFGTRSLHVLVDAHIFTYMYMYVHVLYTYRAK